MKTLEQIKYFVENNDFKATTNGDPWIVNTRALRQDILDMINDCTGWEMMDAEEAEEYLDIAHDPDTEYYIFSLENNKLIISLKNEYDVIFYDDQYIMAVGINGTYDDCKFCIDYRDSSYFDDFKLGSVMIVNVSVNEEVYDEKITK